MTTHLQSFGESGTAKTKAMVWMKLKCVLWGSFHDDWIGRKSELQHVVYLELVTWKIQINRAVICWKQMMHQDKIGQEYIKLLPDVKET